MMLIRRSFLTFVGLTAALMLGLATGHTYAAAVVPDFSAATFVPNAPINNLYFPLIPGTVNRYSGEKADSEDPGETVLEELEDFVTFSTKLILGVQVREVRAREWEDGVLVEDTLDWFAQDTAGNVWYFGEDTKELDEDGNVISTEGSWQAGVNGAQPGFIMPAVLTIGFEYFQESAPADGAVDEAKILSVGETITGPAGTFTNVLRTQESSSLDPGVIEHKLYAPGVGLIRIEEDFDEGTPQTIIELQSVAVIPLPPAILPALATLGVVGWVRRMRRVE